MKKLCCLVILISGLSLFDSCKKAPEKFTEEKPLAVEVTRVRSYYHAQNIVARLEEKGLQPYAVATNDTVAGGSWYTILVGAKKDSLELKNLSDALKADFGLDSLKVVDYENVKENLVEIVEEEITEEARIDANQPDLPQSIFDVIAKFPKSNMFFVQQMYVFSTPQNQNESKMFSQVKNVKMDLPRGISSNRLLNLTDAFAEAIYKDNIYGDQVTLDILKLKPGHGLAQKVTNASFWPVSSSREYQLAIAGFFADLILNTGEYKTEQKDEITVQSFTTLVGYKTVIEPKDGYYRTYLILVDDAGEYVVFCQSTDKSEEELMSILELVGKSQGMIEYDEFYNTFYTLPSKLVEDDIFIGFYIDKLGWSYAKSKDYAKWAKECVGHWAAHGLFYNKNEGPWSYGIFDLLTKEKMESVYKMYSEKGYSGIEQVKVYGTEGYLVSSPRSKGDSWWETVIFPSEVNFTMNRYACMVDNSSDSWLDEEELIMRAHAFQFQKGGYQEETTIESKYADMLTRKTLCNNFESNLRLSIYMDLYDKILELDLTLTHEKMQTAIERNIYYNRLLQIAEGVLLINSVSNAETALEITGDAFSTVGYTSEIFGKNDYTSAIISAFGEALSVMANPTPAAIAGHVATETLGIINNVLATIAINKKSKEYNTISATKSVLTNYYLSCGDFDYIMDKVDVEKVPSDCSSDKLTCIIVQMLENQDSGVDFDYIYETNNKIVMGVNRTFEKLMQREQLTQK